MFVKLTGGAGIAVMNSDFQADPWESGTLNWNGSDRKFNIVNQQTGQFATRGVNECLISLDNETIKAITWCFNKMEEEKELDELCEKHPGLKEARTAFEVMKRLCQ